MVIDNSARNMYTVYFIEQLGSTSFTARDTAPGFLKRKKNQHKTGGKGP